MTEHEFDRCFHALSHETRRKIIDIVKTHPGCNLGYVCKFLDPSRIAVMNHIKTLEESNLIQSQKVGRERRFYLNTVPIQIIFDRWATEYSSFWSSQLTDMKYKLESSNANEIGERNDEQKRKKTS